MYNKSVSKISFPGYCTQNTRLNQNTYKSNQVTNIKIMEETTCVRYSFIHRH